MKKILFFLVLTFLLITVLKCLNVMRLVQGEDVVKTPEKVVEKEEEGEEEEIREDPLDAYKSVNSKSSKFYNNEYTVCEKNVKLYESMFQSVDNYVQRYVSLFLITSNLREYEVKDLNEEILIDLEISIKGQDLVYLQNFSKNTKDFEFLKKFSKLDAIFSDIARLKERSYREKAMRSAMSFFGSIDYYSWLNNLISSRLFSFFTILTVIWTFRRHLFTKSLCVFLVIFINSSIIWEGLNLYLKKIKETDIKLYVEMLEMKDLATECEAANLKWYSVLTKYLWRSKCTRYYETLAKNAAEEVSLLQCVLDMYLFYVVRTPISLLGTSAKDLTETFSSSLPWPLNHFINIPLGVIFFSIVCFFILVMCGKRLRLSFFGASVEIGDVAAAKPEKGQLCSSNNRREKPIRKLKPWTKSRFPIGWTGDCGKLWKLHLKSLSEAQDQNASNLDSSGGALIKQD